VNTSGPKYLRFDVQALPVLYANQAPDMELGFHMHRCSGNILLLATGYMVHTALAVADRLSTMGHSVSVMDLFSLSRFSEEKLKETLSAYAGIVTLEEGIHGRGGLDALITELVIRHNLSARLLPIGVEGGYRFDLGSREVLHENVGIGVNSVLERVNQFIDKQL
jgi:transketolase